MGTSRDATALPQRRARCLFWRGEGGKGRFLYLFSAQKDDMIVGKKVAHVFFARERTFLFWGGNVLYNSADAGEFIYSKKKGGGLGSEEKNIYIYIFWGGGEHTFSNSRLASGTPFFTFAREKGQPG